MATHRRLRIQLNQPSAPPVVERTEPPISPPCTPLSPVSATNFPPTTIHPSDSFSSSGFKEPDSADLSTTSKSLSSRLDDLSINYAELESLPKPEALPRQPGQFFGHAALPVRGAMVTLKGEYFHLGTVEKPLPADKDLLRMRQAWLVKARDLDRRANARRKRMGLAPSMFSAENKREPEHFIPKQNFSAEEEVFADIGGPTTGEYIDDYLEQPVLTNYLGNQDNTPQIHPIQTTLAGLPDPLPRNAARIGISELLPIQRAVIPIIHEGYDVIGVSPTGTGKTASFLIPIIWRILMEYRSGPSAVVLKPRALIMCPTRELADQICKMAVQLCYGTKISSMVIYGAIDTEYLGRKLSEGFDIIVGTPGRLLEAINNKKISFAQVRYVVVDEVDRMLLNRAFPEVVAILESPAFVPPNRRQTMFFSATLAEHKVNILRHHQANPFSVRIGEPGPLGTIAQSFERLKGFNEKENNLHRILDEVGETAKVIVFVRTKDNANMLAASLSGRRAATIHAGFTQKDRVEEMEKFRNGDNNVLVTTDLASRGLDIAGVDVVINFSLPSTVEDYIHRIGRSGRKGHPGRAISFYDPLRRADQYLIGPLITALKGSCIPVDRWLEEEADKGIAGFQVNENASDANDLADMNMFLNPII
ncbi:ATP-dependent RNA helicase DbpA-like [Paramacrobiotus metropolitanus]|uniref:ATP-dependent RNA helicase DbpA-like n=1 Tax=Paramacrobiotus metropolitanus TaxID=2943436 RepID=UPI0024457613|nr:ATP-dependent RNA helicase DbpA-like [Paramacrobiotus metropolitanus]